MQYLTFDDVIIEPQYSTITSRKDVDISTVLGMTLPVISSNMASITEDGMANAMVLSGGLGCLHRFVDISKNTEMFSKSPKQTLVSVGLGEAELDRFIALSDAGASSFVIDVAHGAQEGVVQQCVNLRALMDPNQILIVGNFASYNSTYAFLRRCAEFNISIDGIKIGIGPGSICKTRVQTGCGYPQLSAIDALVNLKKLYPKLILIADGGMRQPGDIAKALAAGADAVMIGGMIAGTTEVPENYRYVYMGSASKEAYEAQNKTASWRATEGDTFNISPKGPVADILQNIEGGLRSAFTYVGARNLKEFQEKAKFIQISQATIKEGVTRNG
jgi:IMP dehydrogenase